MLKVIELVLKFFYRIGRIGPIGVVDLRPAGEPGSNQMSKVVVRNLLGQPLDVLRLFRTRPHEAEIASQDIDRLGQLIEVAPP